MAKAKTAFSPQPAIYRLLTQKQLNQRVQSMLAAEMASARAPILEAQRQAALRAAAARRALQEAGLAAGKLLSGVGRTAQSAYSQAAKETGDLASGFSGSLADQYQAEQAANAKQVEAQGGTAPSSPSAEDLKNTLYDLAGNIPGSSLAEQGAAAGAWGAAQPAVLEAGTEQALAANVAQATQEDQQYVQQLLDLAAKAPAMRNDILNQLFQVEASKANAVTQRQAQDLYAAQFGEKQAVDAANIKRQNALTRQGNIRLKLQAAGLRLRQNTQALAVKKAQVDWGSVDSAKSRASGYLMNGAGAYIRDKNGKKIPVAASSGGKGTSSTGYKQAVRATKSILPQPVLAQGAAGALGKYVAKPNKGQFYPGIGWVTDNPANAVTSGKYTFAEAVAYFMNAYGISKKLARKALIAGGFKPDGKRPTP